MPDSQLLTIGLFSLAAAILVVTGIRNNASVGIILVVALIIVSARFGQTSFSAMGLVAPEDWLRTLMLGLLLGTGLAVLDLLLLQPLFENITKEPHDLRILEGVRGNWKALVSWLVLIWTVVAFSEEVLFRGFMMSQLVKLLGVSSLALALNVVVTSTIFGLAHSYQGRSGTWSTSMIDLCLGVAFVLSGFNLSLPILMHGVINTVELILISRGEDTRLREVIWRKRELAHT